MSIRTLVKERDEQLDLLLAFIRPTTLESFSSLLIYGNPSTGKSYTTKKYMEHAQINNIWIQCDDCVSIKVILKRILQKVQLLVTEDLGDDFIINRNDTLTFDNFLSTLSEIFTVGVVKGHHYIVLDRADELMDDEADLFRQFTRLSEVSRIPNLSVIFITSIKPREIITFGLPMIYFENYDNEQISRILSADPICKFSDELGINEFELRSFWSNYINIIVESFFPYTTNLNVLKRISIKLWDKFTKEIENGNLKTNEFLALYRANLSLLSSDYAFESELKDENEEEQEEDENENETEKKEDEENDKDEDRKSPKQNDNNESGFSITTKYLIIAGYLASFNDSKYDWVFFSKLKGFHKKKQIFRSSKNSSMKLSSRLLEPSSFELERLLAITHALYKLENSKPLISNLDLSTQISNLSTLKILIKSKNNDFINPKTKWKINVNFQYVKNLSDELNFPLENYLAE
ncbi:Origin recognition complex subunit 5 [Wickerhamomyces ciferrii]|uniref:Origin recognition complex subunit 5 n=1 Tax=Wickerhamomyces ciferrii (strain ATCC 14091 / BCRC 22168 / CBS 111 / JCM 3599 / NBRC 0793 / NRRL Y-1031 F-60-10) TaxID=1206466 RepID=K0KJ39_WICCF|nr:Origin recognition complex subunit 5 [Wickerhamomyces ciferrii]CCH42152.1 Origin recognition complex subunit 5 [Wickerhamomyces ciferrii]